MLINDDGLAAVAYICAWAQHGADSYSCSGNPTSPPTLLTLQLPGRACSLLPHSSLVACWRCRVRQAGKGWRGHQVGQRECGVRMVFGFWVKLKNILDHGTSRTKILVVVQSLRRVWLFVIPWSAARQASLSFTISWNLLKLMFIESMISRPRVDKL